MILILREEKTLNILCCDIIMKDNVVFVVSPKSLYIMKIAYITYQNRDIKIK
jgi:hypothetical protein